MWKRKFGMFQCSRCFFKPEFTYDILKQAHDGKIALKFKQCEKYQMRYKWQFRSEPKYPGRSIKVVPKIIEGHAAISNRSELGLTF